MARTTVVIAGKTFPNGRIDTSLLVDTGTPRGALLVAHAAASWKRLVADVQRRYGWSPAATSAGDAYRSEARQRAVFLARYEPRTRGAGPFGDVRYWRGVRYVRVRGAAAAVPGTSNHGAADTIDVSGLTSYVLTRWRQFADVAAEHGWDNAEGRSVSEPWHWRYYSSRDKHRNTTTPPEEPMSRENAMLGVYDALHAAATRDTPTGRQIGDNLGAILQPVVRAEVERALAADARIGTIHARVERYLDTKVSEARDVLRDLLTALPGRVWGFKRSGDGKVRGPDRIDVVQQLADAVTATTGKRPDQIKHPADRKTSTDF